MRRQDRQTLSYCWLNTHRFHNNVWRQTMKYYESLERKLDSLKKKFPSFLNKNNDYTYGRIISIREANPSRSLVHGFCSGRETDRKDCMAMGIMFHGTHKDSVGPIVRDGIYEMSHFTNSFYYAVGRSQYKHGRCSREDAQVIAFAVLVEDYDRLDWKDAKTRSPCRDHALPLFIISVRQHHL